MVNVHACVVKNSFMLVKTDISGLTEGLEIGLGLSGYTSDTACMLSLDFFF